MSKFSGVNNRERQVLPGLTKLPVPLNLSRPARLRLQWMDYYRRHQDASLTCRHFGISRSLFYKWKYRYDRSGPKGLADKSRRPQSVRLPTTQTTHIDLIRKLRRDHPELSKYKLQAILGRDYGIILSASTIGRIITRYKLFFAPPVKPQYHRNRRVSRKRKPAGLNGLKPGDLVEVDPKHLPVFDSKRYAFVAIDRATRRASVHVATTPPFKPPGGSGLAKG